MSHKKNKVLRRRLAGSYLSSLISISLVLLLMGAVLLVVLGTGSIQDYLRENIHMTLVLKQGTPARDAVACQRRIEAKPYVKSTSYISVQQGTEEMARLLGEDFLESFEESPVPSSIEVAIKAEWMSRDNLEQIARELSREPLVEEVGCRAIVRMPVEEQRAVCRHGCWLSCFPAVGQRFVFMSHSRLRSSDFGLR